MNRKERQKCVSRIEELLEELKEDCEAAEEGSAMLHVENEDLRGALDLARWYYELSQREMALLMRLCLLRLPIPLQGHFLDVNPLADPDDPQKGNYEIPEEETDLFLNYL